MDLPGHKQKTDEPLCEILGDIRRALVRLAAQSAILLDDKGVAALLGVSVRKVYSMQAAGELGPKALDIGGRKLWRTADLRAWVAAGCPRREVWLEEQDRESSPCETSAWS